MKIISPVCGIIILCTALASAASLKDDIGYTQLQALLGAQIPTGAGVIVTQVESSSPGSWMPDPTHAQLIGKTITNLSAATPDSYSSHATSVAVRISGMSNSVSPGVNQIEVYDANGWVTTDFLNIMSTAKPDVQTGRIANHSWIGAFADAPVTSNALRRVDWLTETDEYLNLVGTSNNATGVNQPLLSSAFNVISVGSTDGSAMGSTAVDADYSGARVVPLVVTPLSTSSSGTGFVTSIIALLIEAAHSNPSLSHGSKTNRAGDTLYHAEYASVLKAVLMAGADRRTANTSSTTDITDYRLAPAHQSDNGLDTRYGAGQVNVLNSYNILQAGEQDSQEDGNATPIEVSGFDYDPSFGGSQGTNDTATYQFDTTAVASEVKIALVWNIDINGGTFSFNETAKLHNIDLALIDVTTGTTVIESVSTVENTEHIFQRLEAGHQYKIEVRTPGSNFRWNYALAWQVTPLPDFDQDGIPDIDDPDIDNDNMDNDWETLYKLDPYDSTDAGLDNDNDGRSNLAEFNDGGNPNQADTGDANGDGLSSFNDLLLLQQHLLNIKQLNPAAISRSDGNRNGIVDLGDILVLQQQLIQF